MLVVRSVVFFIGGLWRNRTNAHTQRERIHWNCACPPRVSPASAAARTQISRSSVQRVRVAYNNTTHTSIRFWRKKE